MKLPDRLLRIVLPMGAYVLVLLGSLWFLHAAPGSPWRVPIVLAPVVPIAFAVWDQLRARRELDELEQRILLEGSSIAQTTFVLGCITYGFLQFAGLPGVNFTFVAAALVFLTMLGRRVARWKYR